LAIWRAHDRAFSTSRAGPAPAVANSALKFQGARTCKTAILHRTKFRSAFNGAFIGLPTRKQWFANAKDIFDT
jgi:hypothetical protein